MATERISERQIGYSTAEKSLVKVLRNIKDNRYYIYSAIILIAIAATGFMFRGFV